MLDLISVTLLSFAPKMLGGRGRQLNERNIEATNAIWQRFQTIKYALPLEARLYGDINMKDDKYDRQKLRIAEEFPVPRDVAETFNRQSFSFSLEIESQRPYISEHLYNLLVAYIDFLDNTLTVAKYHMVISGLRLPWERKPDSALNRKQKRQYEKCSYGSECFLILEDAIYREVRKAIG